MLLVDWGQGNGSAGQAQVETPGGVTGYGKGQDKGLTERRRPGSQTTRKAWNFKSFA